MDILQVIQESFYGGQFDEVQQAVEDWTSLEGDTIIPMSSAVTELYYEPDALALHVQYINGGRYIYWGVPLDVWGRFKEANSKGEFVNYYIKAYYPFTKEN